MIDQAVDLIRKSRYTIALTGAGFSTPSGIPDFRSPESGLWNNADAMRVASLSGFTYDPLGFYTWIRPFAELIRNAKPNPAHLAMASLEKQGILHAVITQNIDMLHTEAGSKEVYEVHGHMRQMTCINCFKEYDSAPILKEHFESEKIEVPRCPACGGALKPDVILFGEQLPMQVFIKAQQAVRKADLMLVAGSSLEVHPVADFPGQVRRQGGQVIIVNKERTVQDDIASVVIRGDVAEILPAIVDKLASE